MLIDEIRNQKALIQSIAHQYGANRIRVFGSVSKGEDRSDSDVDFLVSLPVGYDLFAQRLPLAEKLSELLGRKVDLIPEHELNQHIRQRVLDEAVDL